MNNYTNLLEALETAYFIAPNGREKVRVGVAIENLTWAKKAQDKTELNNERELDFDWVMEEWNGMKGYKQVYKQSLAKRLFKVVCEEVQTDQWLGSVLAHKLESEDKVELVRLNSITGEKIIDRDLITDGWIERFGVHMDKKDVELAVSEYNTVKPVNWIIPQGQFKGYEITWERIDEDFREIVRIVLCKPRPEIRDELIKENIQNYWWLL